MNLVSMKMTPKEARAESGLLSDSDEDLPEYPWGLTICLEDEQLQKLGMDGMPPVGTVMMLSARVTVTRTSVNATQAGKDTDIGLQITDMALDAGQVRSTADVLYGKKD